MKLLLFLAFLFLPLSFIFAELARAPFITLSSESVLQGEPLLVSLHNVSDAKLIQSMSFEGKVLKPFIYKGTVAALIGIDLNQKPGKYPVSARLSDGSRLEKVLTVKERKKVSAPLGIPAKLGGNTAASAAKLVGSLASENERLRSARTFPRALWSEGFISPVAKPVVTDPFGYSRETVGYSIPHKGADFKAPPGTKVFAANRGIVRIAREGRVYGKTILIDHGLGLSTIYLHLSKIKVNEGELVHRGQFIALSGESGYAESPHLHLSVWLQAVSVDPVKFLNLFQL